MRSSFRNAINGLFAGLCSERNLRVHIAAAFYVIIAGFVTGISKTEWCAVLLCIGTVTGAELLNTAIEKLCDGVCKGFSKEIGQVKDIAAGAVLVFSIAAAVVGTIVFINAVAVKNAIEFARDNPVFSILILMTVPITVYLIFRRYDK